MFCPPSHVLVRRERFQLRSGVWRIGPPYNVAIIYAGLGEKDQAFAWLERAYKDRSYYLPVYLTTDARLDDLHSDPRFISLRRRIGLP
jgi:hypothetical protein